jgi:hypothetical protein
MRVVGSSVVALSAALLIAATAGVVAFNGVEHSAIGAAAWNKFSAPSSSSLQGMHPFKFSENAGAKTLSFGQIMGLTGLLFSEETPLVDVCEPSGHVDDSHGDAPSSNLMSGEERHKIEGRFLQMFDRMEAEVERRQLSSAEPLLSVWGETTAEWLAQDRAKNRDAGTFANRKHGYKMFALHRKLYDTAHYDQDNYGRCAEKAYIVGHGLAIAQAQRARDWASEPLKQRACLSMAFSLEAMAAHYLTQLFSSEGLRLPRAAIINECGVFDAYALSRAMAKEDAFFGLPVTNTHSDEWHAFGTGRFADTRADKTKYYAVEAIEHSLSEVFAAYEISVRGIATRPPTVSTADLIPHVDTRRPFNPPLFMYDTTKHIVLFRDESDADAYRPLTPAGKQSCIEAWRFAERVRKEIAAAKTEGGLEVPTFEEQKYSAAAAAKKGGDDA